MDEASSRFVDQLVLEKLLSEKLGKVRHAPRVDLESLVASGFETLPQGFPPDELPSNPETAAGAALSTANSDVPPFTVCEASNCCPACTSFCGKVMPHTPLPFAVTVVSVGGYVKPGGGSVGSVSASTGRCCWITRIVAPGVGDGAPCPAGSGDGDGFGAPEPAGSGVGLMSGVGSSNMFAFEQPD